MLIHTHHKFFQNKIIEQVTGVMTKQNDSKKAQG